MARLLSLSEQSDPGNRGRLTRSPVTTAVVLMSHHDVIPGFPLVIDLLWFNVLRFALTHLGMKSVWSGATVHKQPVLDLNGVITVVRELSS